MIVIINLESKTLTEQPHFVYKQTNKQSESINRESAQPPPPDFFPFKLQFVEQGTITGAIFFFGQVSCYSFEELTGFGILVSVPPDTQQLRG